MKKCSVLLVFLVATFIVNAQTRQPQKIVISGTVYGYSFDPAVKLLKKDSGVELEGSISNVNLTAFKGSSKISSAKSTGNGEFIIEFPLEKDLKLEYAKDGYASSSFLIDLSAVPADMAATGLVFEYVELALNSFVSDKTNDKRPFGKLTYHSGNRALAFEEIVYSDKKKLLGDNKDNNPMNLMNRSIKKNSDKNTTAKIPETPQEVVVTETKSKSSKQVQTQEEVVAETTTAALVNKLSSLPVFSLENITSTDLESRKAELDNAWEQLEKDKLLALTPEDFILIQAREELLLAAEKELEDARKFIDLQKEEIAAQNLKLILMTGLLILLGIFVFFIIRYAKQKAKLNKELAAKNKKITESINYALRIQQSVLLTEVQVKEILPESFIYYQPLDIVSGDFYWVSEIDSKVIIAVADCTGHGVPGAFMSLIGNTLLNQIVNEKRIISAAEILNKLHEGIISALRQNESDLNNQDGMDMSLCVIDKKQQTVEFCGAMNPGYLVKDNEVVQLEPTLKAIGGIERRKKGIQMGFESHIIQMEKGTRIYLTTDGFMDQFGGPENSKFNLPKFKTLLLNLSDKKMVEQKEEFAKALNNWKGNGRQIDDILVVGFSS